MKLTYDISTLVPYINWVYFYHAWQLKQPVEQQKIKAEAEQFLLSLENRYHAYALFHIYDAHSDGDDIVLLPSQNRLPCLRQQDAAPCLSLADFIHPKQDKVGIFVTSVDRGMETDFDADPYQKMMAQLLADRLAEAAAELMHLQVRIRYWGYAPDEHLSIAELHQEHFQGIRPAVGYPSLPDASINFLLDELLDMQQIGVSLTESGAMRPHASVSGLMISHPQARYFSIGRIGNDQLCDYAARRGMSVENIRKFLSANL
ncbi:MAG: 5-methyltetrahydrofolate--homocysteine methyltransferase [Prevotella sp.]|nr:5-methyltetrahydrofolate--homocysteine methyltransferase [Prevotella sp.]